MTDAVNTPGELAIPAPRPGERLAGLALDDAGNPSHWLYLLPGDNDGDTWNNQMAWAKSIGGDLPSPREQSLLVASLKGEFRQIWYWSNAEARSGYAWSQDFHRGSEHDLHRKDDRLRARAVRRLPIQSFAYFDVREAA